MTRTEQEFLIEDLEDFRVIDNPLRQRILHLARHPKSVRELADALGVPVTRLYYHVNMLEESGFIEAVDVRKSGAQLERIYQSRKGVVRPSPELVDRIEDKQKAAHILAGVLLDITRVETEALIERGLRGEDVFGDLARAVLQLPTPVAEDFRRRLEELVHEMRDAATANDDKDAPIYSFTYAFVPTDIP